VAIFGPYLLQSPLIYHPNLINPTFSRPNGPLGGISVAHPFGVEPVTGRDILSRVVNGARVSLVIAFLATTLAVGIGVTMGVIAGGLPATSPRTPRRANRSPSLRRPAESELRQQDQ
jgi:ABC-type dipeptide/oligopeptide/nickel transport system permease subunit